MFEFIQDKYMERSVNLAKLIQKEFRTTAGRPDKGVHQAGFLVLRATSMPSALIEVGYISTPDEERYLNSAEGIRNMGRSIYNAFVNYKKNHHGKTTATAPKTVAQREVQPVAEPKPEPEETKADTPKRPDNAISADAALPEESIVTEGAAETEPEPEAKKAEKANTNDDIVFKVQFYTHQRRLPAGSKQFKGLKNVDCYQENNTYKYTYGATTNYKEILAERKKVTALFPDAFVIAVCNGVRMNLSEAIQLTRKNK